MSETKKTTKRIDRLNASARVIGMGGALCCQSESDELFPVQNVALIGVRVLTAELIPLILALYRTYQ